METLAPREAYDEDELGVTRNLPLWSGLYFGTMMGLFKMIEKIIEGAPAGEVIGLSLFAALFCGVFFGFGFGGWASWSARRANDRVYAGDPRVVAPPPPGHPFRLPCGLMRTPRRAVAGVLYLGPRGLRFQPHLKTRKADREALVMEPLERIEIERVDVPLPAWMAVVFAVHTAPRVEVRWPEGRAQLTIPATDDTFPRLREAMDALRAAAPAPEAA